MSTTPRNYRAEYLRRIARGAARGLTRSQARGHPKPKEAAIRQIDVTPARRRKLGSKRAMRTAAESRQTKPARKQVIPYDRQLESGLQELRAGKSLSASARAVHVAPERLRRYASNSSAIKWRGDHWIVRADHRRRQILTYSRGEAIVVTVRLPTARAIGEYMSAVGQFLETNDPAPLAAFRGQAFTDTAGKRHPFETDPNTLYELADTGSATFEDVYRIVA